MYPAKFDYHRAGSVQEALSLLQDHEDAKILAGGHSLLPAMKLRLAQPAVIIDIGKVDELQGVSQDNGSIRIGAMTTHDTLANSDILQSGCAVMAEAAGQIGDQQVRNKGTIGGSLVHADPAADWPAAVAAVGGVMHITGPNGDRQVSVSDFFVDLLETAIEENELLTAVEVQALGDNSGSAYVKFEHPASGFAICGAAAVVTLNSDGSCESASLCYNGVTATTYNASAVADALAGSNLDDAAIDQAVEANISIDDPMHDIHASGEYRVALAKVYGKRALKAARDRAKG